jgi:hypothetical protein
VSFAAIKLCVASQRVFIFVVVYFVMTQSGNFWIYPRYFISVNDVFHTVINFRFSSMSILKTCPC